MADRPPSFDIAHGVPPVSVSSTTTRDNRTGAWKAIRPVFRDWVAPCNQACPVGIDVEAYMVLVRESRIAEAIDVLLRENPLPATTGRVCYHACETICNRSGFDQPVSIHAVERMLGDLALEAPMPIAVPRTHHERVAVIGAGPAGLACAYHLARLGYGVVAYEAESEPGGILRYGIPEYRLPKSIVRAEIERIAALGVEFRCGVRVGRDTGFEEIAGYDAVFVASGAHRSRPLQIEGAELAGILPGLQFLCDVNRGAAPEIGQRVAVVGGGNTAIDCARTALRLGSEVVVLYRRGRAEMPAHPEEIEHAVCEGVRFEFLTAPVAFLSEAPDRADGLDGVSASFGGDAGGATGARVTRVRCGRMRLGKLDASRRRRPVPVPGRDYFVRADTVLLALGEDADVDFVPGLTDGATGTVGVNAVCRTGRAAVFAGGDLIEEPHTVAFALGSGKRAAIGIDDELARRRGESTRELDVGAIRFGTRGNLSATKWRADDPIRRNSPVNEVVHPDTIHTPHFMRAARHPDRFRPAERTRLDFREAVRGLTREDALAEARRCLNCGVCNACDVCLIFCPDVAISKRPDGTLVIDEDHCKGCGICAAECPRGAITMTREGV